METNKLLPPLLLIVLFIHSSITTAYHLNNKLSNAISALRSHGYNLFADTITESHFLLLLPGLLSQNSTLTFFSPPDSLFSPSNSLFHFVSQSKIPASCLEILSHGTCHNTLLPHHHRLIQRIEILSRGTISDSVIVDEMRVSLPDVFIGLSIVVHGVDEVLFGGIESEFLWINKLVIPYVSSSVMEKNGKKGTDVEMLDLEKIMIWIRNPHE